MEVGVGVACCVGVSVRTRARVLVTLLLSHALLERHKDIDTKKRELKNMGEAKEGREGGIERESDRHTPTGQPWGIYQHQ